MLENFEKALRATLKKHRGPAGRAWIKALLRGDAPAKRKQRRGGKHRKAAHK